MAKHIGGSAKSRDFELAVQGYRLTTVEITYWMPDHPHLLQSFVWQNYDLAPNFPALQRFLEFWKDNIEAPVHSVRVAGHEALEPPKVRSANAVYDLH